MPMERPMPIDFDYREYAVRPSINEYNEYQERYKEQPRYSDLVILDLVGEVVSSCGSREVSALDIGCSTGNLLRHLKRRFRDLRLAGGDLAASSIEQCRNSTELADIDFHVLDILSMEYEERFDIAITNAVTCYFDWDQYDRAIANVARSLAHGGRYIAFEWFHPFVHQDIQIFETTVFHPEGLRLCFRPYAKVAACLKKHGFTGISFQPFRLPIELPRPAYDEEVVTYTVKATDGTNMPFRGALFQPWCHLMAVKG